MIRTETWPSESAPDSDEKEQARDPLRVEPSVTRRLYPEGIRVTRYFLASLDPMLVLTMTGPTRPEGEAMP
jgi:hypothetical protein